VGCFTNVCDIRLSSNIPKLILSRVVSFQIDFESCQHFLTPVILAFQMIIFDPKIALQRNITFCASVTCQALRHSVWPTFIRLIYARAKSCAIVG